MSDGSALVNLAAISLGSNIRPEQNLPAAVGELRHVGEIRAVSRVWESAPVGFSGQPNFLNAALLFATTFSADELKQSVLRPIEEKLGRVRDPGNVNAPRTIDLDLSIFITPNESRVFDKDILTRNFVAVPLAELLPDFIHPETGQTLSEIARSFGGAKSQLKPRPDCRMDP